MTAVQLPSSRPFTPHSSPPSTGPSTPMSGISTIAIKDGHPGHRPSMSSFDGAAERISRLTRPESNSTGSSYFDYIRDPTYVSGTRASSDELLSSSSSISIGPSPVVPPPTPVTPIMEEDEFGRKRKKGNALAVPVGQGIPGFTNIVQQRILANPSPASTITTSSAAESRREARLVGGMTYDEGVVDTTDKSPMPVREDTPLLNEEDKMSVDTEAMDEDMLNGGWDAEIKRNFQQKKSL